MRSLSVFNETSGEINCKMSAKCVKRIMIGTIHQSDSLLQTDGVVWVVKSCEMLLATQTYSSPERL